MPPRTSKITDLSSRSSLTIALNSAPSISTYSTSHERSTRRIPTSLPQPPRSILSTSTSASSRRQEKRSRAVRFSTRAVGRIIPSKNDMTDSQIADLWVTDADSEASQRSVVTAVRTLRRILEAHPEDLTSDGSTHNIDERHNICTRGLEHMRSTVHLEQMRINKDCHYDAIFDEQDRQDDRNIYDFDMMAVVSQHGSAWARERALERARGDEICMEAVREEMRLSGDWEELMLISTSTTNSHHQSQGQSSELDVLEQGLANSLLSIDKPSTSPQDVASVPAHLLGREPCLGKSTRMSPTPRPLLNNDSRVWQMPTLPKQEGAKTTCSV